MDQQRARQWLAEVGETRLMAIAKAATSVKRPAFRPPLGYEPLVLEAAVMWVSNPEMGVGEAALLTAKRITDQKDWKGYPPLAAPTLRRRIRTSLRAMEADLSIGSNSLASKAEALAKARGLPSRLNPVPEMPPSTLGELVASRVAETQKQSLLVPVPGARITAAVTAAMQNLTGSTERVVQRYKRVSYLAAALDGRVDPNTRVSVLVAALNDLVAVLNGRAD